MNIEPINRVLSVFEKEVKSELRNRYSISAVVLFIITTITIILFASAGEDITPGMASGLIWIIMFFSAMTGLGRSFVSEEERGTSLYLKLTTSAGAIYFGKLIFNIVLSLSLNTIAVILFFLFLDSLKLRAFETFVITHLLGSIGIAGASTIISAIIARANTKGALFPVLSFPIILPLLMFGIETTRFSLDGTPFDSAMNNFGMMFSYSGIIITLSYFLFDFVWKE